MGWVVDISEAKTKEDYINLLNEINAYRELDGQDFDFGTGLIINEMSFGSEDAYYEMDLQAIEEIIEYWGCEFDIPKRKNIVKRDRQYRRYVKQKEKKRIKHLSEISWMNVINRGDWQQRCYRGKRSKHLKSQSHRRVRKYKDKISSKGNMSNKIFDFWWELY